MKRQNDLGVGSSIALTILFAVMAVFTYQTDPSEILSHGFGYWCYSRNYHDDNCCE